MKLRPNRRGFLRGAAGVVLALPFLESVLPKEARGAPAPKRFIAFLECNGVNMQKFFPATAYGALTDASFTGTGIEPLAPHKDKLLIPRGIHTVPRGYGFDPSNGCDHKKGMGHKLTAQALLGSFYPAGISVDQAIATKLNPNAAPALTLNVCNKADDVLGHISYSGSEQPVSGENNPWLAYQDLVGVVSPDQQEAMRLKKRRESVLDLVSVEYKALLARPDLSKADRDKLDAHFTAVRNLEQGMQNGLTCNLPAGSVAAMQALDPNTITYDSEYKAIGQMQMDIIAMAIACGANHAATLQWGNGAGGPIFTWDGMMHQYNHHKLSHGNTKDDNSGGAVAGYLDMLFQIDQWYATQFKYLLDKLASYDDGGGQTVLDNTIACWMNDLSDGKAHDFRDMPFVIAGGGGYLKQGQYIKVTAQADTLNDADAPHNKLLNTFLNGVGVPSQSFGDLTFGEPGEFDQLKV